MCLLLGSNCASSSFLPESSRFQDFHFLSIIKSKTQHWTSKETQHHMFIGILLVLPVCWWHLRYRFQHFLPSFTWTHKHWTAPEVPTWIQDTVAHAEAIQIIHSRPESNGKHNKTDVIKTHFGYWDVPLSTRHGGKRRHNNKCWNGLRSPSFSY